jgi:hypothetical protein
MPPHQLSTPLYFRRQFRRFPHNAHRPLLLRAPWHQCHRYATRQVRLGPPHGRRQRRSRPLAPPCPFSWKTTGTEDATART